MALTQASSPGWENFGIVTIAPSTKNCTGFHSWQEHFEIYDDVLPIETRGSIEEMKKGLRRSF
jgi:hypothetical protein